MYGSETARWARLDFDAVGAYAVVEWEERLSSALAAGWNMQRACEVPVDGHMNGPGAARSPSWVNLGKVELEKIGATLGVAPLFADAFLRDQGSNRLVDADQGKD